MQPVSLHFRLLAVQRHNCRPLSIKAAFKGNNSSYETSKDGTFGRTVFAEMTRKSTGNTFEWLAIFFSADSVTNPEI